ncbi:hypothetical protein GJ496_001404 [Pomphorhynchus laevis]|nr:hypothetical protein GJ496_001404 [Pomphorhynchus laevis]
MVVALVIYVSVPQNKSVATLYKEFETRLLSFGAKRSKVFSVEYRMYYSAGVNKTRCHVLYSTDYPSSCFILPDETPSVVMTKDPIMDPAGSSNLYVYKDSDIPRSLLNMNSMILTDYMVLPIISEMIENNILESNEYKLCATGDIYLWGVMHFKIGRILTTDQQCKGLIIEIANTTVRNISDAWNSIREFLTKMPISEPISICFRHVTTLKPTWDTFHPQEIAIQYIDIFDKIRRDV